MSGHVGQVRAPQKEETETERNERLKLDISSSCVGLKVQQTTLNVNHCIPPLRFYRVKTSGRLIPTLNSSLRV